MSGPGAELRPPELRGSALHPDRGASPAVNERMRGEGAVCLQEGMGGPMHSSGDGRGVRKG